MKKYNLKTIMNLITLGLTAILLVCCAFGWYVTNIGASVNGGTGSTAQSGGELIIRKTADGEDISYQGDATVSAGNKLAVQINDDKTKLYPDSYGSFNFFVEYDESSHSDTYSANISFEVKASQVIDEENKAVALKYINSHIMMFQSYDSTNHKFSNWIEPSGANYEVEEDSENYMKEITVYWLWIGEYTSLFSDRHSSPIASEDLSSIRSYYSSNLDKMFEAAEKSESGYNGADYVIGTSLKKIYFELTAVKGV